MAGHNNPPQQPTQRTTVTISGGSNEEVSRDGSSEKQEEAPKSPPVVLDTPRERIIEKPPIPEVVVKKTGAPTDDGMVDVVPMVTVNQIRIGEPFYQFQAGALKRIPREIVPFLEERGIIPRIPSRS